MPVLVVAGALDSKFAALAERMAGAIGANATLALIPGAGHAAHLERPVELLAVPRPWLAAHGLLPRQTARARIKGARRARQGGVSVEPWHTRGCSAKTHRSERKGAGGGKRRGVGGRHGGGRQNHKKK